MEEYFERPLYLKDSHCFSSIQNSDFPPKMLATAKRVNIQILSWQMNEFQKNDS